MKSKLIFLSLALILTSCATIFKGTSQAVTFNSIPEGAEVLVDGNIVGRTPTTVNLKKNKHKNVMIRLQGYETTNIALDTSFDPITFLNIFWDSSTTDLLTGNAWEYEPGFYSVRLQPVASVSAKK